MRRHLVPAMDQNAVSYAASLAGVSLATLRGRSRAPGVVRARWAVALYLRNKGHSLPRIGRALHRDHSSVLHAVNCGGRLMDTDAGFRALYDAICKRPQRLSPRPYTFWTLIVSQAQIDAWRERAAA